jgi:hypothetical protein
MSGEARVLWQLLFVRLFATETTTLFGFKFNCIRCWVRVYLTGMRGNASGTVLTSQGTIWGKWKCSTGKTPQ